MSNGIASLADYQDWLNTIKQRVQSARLRVALAAKPCPFVCEPFWQRPVAKFGQQRVDQIPSVRWHVTGYAS